MLTPLHKIVFIVTVTCKNSCKFFKIAYLVCFSFFLIRTGKRSVETSKLLLLNKLPDTVKLKTFLFVLFITGELKTPYRFFNLKTVIDSAFFHIRIFILYSISSNIPKSPSLKGNLAILDLYND